MQNASVARRYARALYELARERGQVDEVGRELELVVRTLDAHRDLRALWEHAEVSARVKLALIEQTFAGKVSGLVRNFVAVLAQKRREVYLGAIAREYTALADEALNRVEVEVRSAAPLSPDTLVDLQHRLGARLGKQIKFVTTVDQDLMGGLVIRVGDVLMDGSVRTRLKRMKERLASAGAGSQI